MMKALSYHRRRKIRWQRLPFVAGKSHWAVPATGGHLGGVMTGEAMAIAYLKHLRETPDPLLCLGSLHLVANALYGMDGVPARDDASLSRRGQRAGFFNELTRFLWLVAQHQGAPLDAVSDAMILDKANKGLQYQAP